MVEFDWDEYNIAHIALHRVTPEEAEEVVLNDPIDLDYEDVNGEERIEQIGETLALRVLTVVTVERETKVRVVTAFEPSRAMRVDYLKARRRRDAR